MSREPRNAFEELNQNTTQPALPIVANRENQLSLHKCEIDKKNCSDVVRSFHAVRRRVEAYRDSTLSSGTARVPANCSSKKMQRRLVQTLHLRMLLVPAFAANAVTEMHAGAKL